MAEFHQGADLRKELQMVSVSILGKAESSFFIAHVTDMRTGRVNDIITPNRNAKIVGGKLKIAGEDPSCGVYFVNADSGERVKIDTADIVENRKGYLLVVTPALAAGTWQVEVTTQYTSSSDFLKEPRTVLFDRPLTVAPYAP